MSEKISVKSGRHRQIQSLIDGGESVENFASEIENATAEFREAQETIGTITNEFTKIQEDLELDEKEIKDTQDITKTASQGSQPELTDFIRDPLEQ